MACVTDRIFIGDVGTKIQVTLKDCDTPIDVSSAIVKQFIFLKPDETLLTKTASFLTDGSDGVIFCIFVDGDLDLTGTWKLQAYVELPSGKWKSTIDKFKVYDDLG